MKQKVQLKATQSQRLDKCYNPGRFRHEGINNLNHCQIITPKAYHVETPLKGYENCSQNLKSSCMPTVICSLWCCDAAGADQPQHHTNPSRMHIQEPLPGIHSPLATVSQAKWPSACSEKQPIIHSVPTGCSLVAYSTAAWCPSLSPERSD